MVSISRDPLAQVNQWWGSKLSWAYEFIPVDFLCCDADKCWWKRLSFLCKESLRLPQNLSFPWVFERWPQFTMTVSIQPEAAMSPLPKADGSATYSYAGYTITASANGPVEAQKRDEHPYEALVDVVVRPASGVGGQFSGQPEKPIRKHLLTSPQ